MRQREAARSEPTAGAETETTAAGVEALASQARLAVDDRQRIEQNIHDGIQQRLTALRIRLSLAAERFADRDDQDAAATLFGFGDQVEEAIDELREVAHGGYPHLRPSSGPAPGLRAAAVRSAHPVTVHADGVGRCPRQIESAVYFSVLA